MKFGVELTVQKGFSNTQGWWVAQIPAIMILIKKILC